MIDRIISIFFLLSGVSALIYQVLWAKYLGLLFGNTAQAQTIVLATFLGGLAIGNAIVGRIADKSKHPLKLYGWFELGIALFAGLSPTYFRYVADLYFKLASSENTILPFFLRLLFSVAIILVPTILMGGTLPLLTRFVTRSLGQMQRNVSWLYFINSGGAAAGALIAGFILIPTLGLDLSVSVAAGLNAFAGLGSIMLSKGRSVEERGREEEPVASDQPILSKRQYKLMLLAVFLSGIISLSYEIAWVRLLALILGSSAYSFSLMLAAFITGIALGSMLVEREVFPKLPSYLLFGLAELCIFASIALTLPLYERLPFEFLRWKQIFSPTLESFYPYEALKLSFCFFLTLLPTTFLGMTLPFATRAITNNINEVGAGVGKIFSSNTIGNVSGAVLSGLWLLPAVGMEGLLRLGLLLNAAIGLLIIVTAPACPPKLRVSSITAALLLIGYQHLAVPSWDKNMISTGVFRRGGVDSGISFREYRKGFSHQTLKYYKDDSNATVAVTEYSPSKTRVLRINGKPDASDDHDMATQVLLAELPLFINTGAKDALIIGLGSGVTAGSALRHPLDSLDVVEISLAVKESAEHFSHVNYNVLNNPRAAIHIDDALSFLKLSSKKFDLIISEPSNPWVAGVGNLFTVEFYERAKQSLKPGGLMVQWFHTYEMSDHIVRLVLRTLASVFPYMTVWNSLISSDGSGDYLILASLEPINPNFAAMATRLERPEVKADLERIDITSLASLLALQTETEESVKDLVDKGQFNFERFPRLEYQAPIAFFLDEGSKLFSSHDMRLSIDREGDLHLSRFVKERGVQLSKEEFQSLFKYNEKWGNRDLLWKLLTAWGEHFPDESTPLWYKAQIEAGDGAFASATMTMNRLVESSKGDLRFIEPAADLEIQKIKKNRSSIFTPSPDKAFTLLDRLAEVESEQTASSSRAAVLVKGVSLAFDFGDAARAERYLRTAKILDQKNPQIKPLAELLVNKLQCTSCRSLLQ